MMKALSVPVQKVAGDPQKRAKMRVPVQCLDRDRRSEKSRLTRNDDFSSFFAIFTNTNLEN